MIEIKGRYTTALVMIDDIEEECLKQIYSMVNHVAFDAPVRIMPDTHHGSGAVIGFSMPLGTKIVPSVVGCDLGCGVLSMNIGKSFKINLADADNLIRENIPMGFNIHETCLRPKKMENFSFSKHFPWEEVSSVLNDFFYSYNKKFNTSYLPPEIDYRSFVERFKKITDIKKIANSCGTMGGNNHFWEIGRSEKNDDIWITVHSGSRNFGKVIYEYHEKVAKSELNFKRNDLLRKEIEKITKETKDKEQIPNLIKNAKQKLGLDSDVDLRGMEYLEGEELKEYLVDMVIAQVYASFNRRHMMEIVCEVLGVAKNGDTIESIHNYIDFKDFVIRKGAIRSYVGEKILIPFNMRDGILLCEGKSNVEWNCTSPHGAGRIMSRAKAKELLSLEHYERQMKGIYSSSINKGTLDESPSSYKDSAMIEAAIEPTATVLDKIVPILNIKAKNSGPSFKERKEEKKRNNERQAARELKQKNR